MKTLCHLLVLLLTAGSATVSAQSGTCGSCPFPGFCPPTFPMGAGPGEQHACENHSASILQFANLSDADLFATDLSGADLTGADLSGAEQDFAAVSATPRNLPLPFGTLLCGPPYLAIQAVGPGTPFAFAVPLDCGLVGPSGPTGGRCRASARVGPPGQPVAPAGPHARLVW